MNKEKLMDKVNKLLALAGNNPSEAEAQAAMLKAQKLIAEYNLDMGSFKEKDEIVMLRAEHPNNNGYRTHLAVIIAENFRCKAIMSGSQVHFIGYKADAEVCVEVFNYAYKICRRGGQRAERLARKKYGYNPSGTANSYFRGFCKGVEEVLNEQCKALMIIVPEEVKEELHKRSGGTYKGGMRLTGYSNDAYEQGHRDGRDHFENKKIGAQYGV